MSHLLYWPTITYFYPVGNTSAVCLTEHLPLESNADILLLACGDPRHVLYTMHVNDNLSCARAFDITCCDVDVAVLARNALLFTLLADDNLDGLWELFYHMFINQTSLSILFEQCRKLIPLAENIQTWKAGPYGHFLTTCDAGTLAEIRRVWTTYLDTANWSSKQAKRFEQQFADGIKEMNRKTGPGGISSALRSAGPLVFHASSSVASQSSNYWSSGITDAGAQIQDRKQRLSVNPLFAFSIDGDKFAVHYGTDPLSGFHLAEAFASGKFTQLHERIPPREMVRVARVQFSRWCASVSRRLRGDNPSSPTFVIRMFGGDALTFCQALKYCDVTRSPVTPYTVAAWRLPTITLDDDWYGRHARSRAPLSFNVIDTSNILDHVGLLNILVVTAPLLCKTPSATLYTEALLRVGDDPSQAILEHLGGNLPTMALLFGVAPSTLMSQFTTRSNVHEALTPDEGAKQYYERLAWKAIEPTGQHGPRLRLSPKDLAIFFYRVYLHMFSDEDVSSRFRLLSLSREQALRELQRSSILHYNRRSFALFVHFAKTRMETDWWRAMDLFEDLVLADERLMTGQHAYQELCCQLHLLGIYTSSWMSAPALRRFVHDEEDLGLFREWSHIPPVVTVMLVVPRDAIARLERDFMDAGTPVLQCDMQDGPRQNWFAVTSVACGTLELTGIGEHRTATIVESVVAGAMSQPPWRTKAPLIMSFSVPTISVMDFAQNPRTTVGLALRQTMGASFNFIERLGYDLTVFRTRLTNAESVFVLSQAPIARTCKGKDTSTVMAGHWQENISSEQANPDVTYIEVQMNDEASAVRSFVVHVNITDPSARAALANAGTIPTVKSDSRSHMTLDACLKIGAYAYTIHFPLPVDVARASLRIARRSSYVEMVAPLASFDVRPTRDLSSRFAPLCLAPEEDRIPTLGSIHYINLDQCPTFKLASGGKNWHNIHITLMFSELERRRALRAKLPIPNTDAPDTLMHVKQTLHLLLGRAAGAHPDDQVLPQRVFALVDTTRKAEYLYVIVARTCLDVGSHTVVADAFVAPSVPAVREALGVVALQGLGSTFTGSDNGIGYISTDADETEAWFHLLPRLTERCRTWPHMSTCIYRTQPQPGQKPKSDGGMLWGGTLGPLCGCGMGLGTEVLPRAFEPIAQHLTRAALSPLFSVPYLTEVDTPIHRDAETTQNLSENNKDITVTGNPTVGVLRCCRSCGKEGGLACSRCKRARYCSKVCQRTDWKEHKKDCGSSACAPMHGMA